MAALHPPMCSFCQREMYEARHLVPPTEETISLLKKMRGYNKMSPATELAARCLLNEYKRNKNIKAGR